MRLIRLKEVMSISGLGRSSIYKFMEEGRFPMSISLGERAIAWEVSEVEEWVLDKIEGRNKLVEPKQQGKVSEIDVTKYINDKFSLLSINEAITWLMQVYKQAK
ncbi:AlpA family transcriptional regulator [Colwellia psychrerythraea]|uniref:Phage transcriptional regulator, AlpA n=1 Tax=Colwellia psychrerythraea (strain 34H / ATCC BAA-681) TaxID=167879 RepID=Q47ZW9_COLP3|nr:hypothetical protein CPS_2950 [Colwellia psychrerythraea 34H]